MALSTDGPIIPEIWQQHIHRAAIKQLSVYDKYIAQLPPPQPRPWHRRLRDHIHAFTTANRERLALRIAPWLEPEDWHDL